MIAALLLLAAPRDVDYRVEMRGFVRRIAERARAAHPGFLVIPQNGHELLDDAAYRRILDGVGREDLFYGYEEDDEPTPAAITQTWLEAMRLAERSRVEVLAIDYCSTPEHVEDSYARCAREEFISFAADERGLDSIPRGAPFHENPDDVRTLHDARNFLYLINPGRRGEFLDAVRGTNHDLVVIDAYVSDGALTEDEVASLRRKANGGARLAVAYLSIGEAEDYRPYWRPEWRTDPPPWLAEENPDWRGNFKVRYWDPAWQEIVFAALDGIVAAGFDGVYLDLIDAFEYFEERDD